MSGMSGYYEHKPAATLLLIVVIGDSRQERRRHGAQDVCREDEQRQGEGRRDA